MRMSYREHGTEPSYTGGMASITYTLSLGVCKKGRVMNYPECAVCRHNPMNCPCPDYEPRR